MADATKALAVLVPFVEAIGAEATKAIKGGRSKMMISPLDLDTLVNIARSYLEDRANILGERKADEAERSAS